MSIGKRTKASHLHEALAGGETSIIQRNIGAIQVQFEVNQQKRLSKIWTSCNDDLAFINNFLRSSGSFWMITDPRKAVIINRFQSNYTTGEKRPDALQYANMKR